MAGSPEAPSCEDEIIYVVGGANSAGSAAMHFAKYAEEFMLLVGCEGLSSTMSRYLIRSGSTGAEHSDLDPCRHGGRRNGATRLEEISVRCSDTTKVERVPASSMFIFIWSTPENRLVRRRRRKGTTEVPTD